MMDERLREKLQIFFLCFYLQRKLNELRSRRNLVRFLELKLKNKQRLVKACLELFVQYICKYISSTPEFTCWREHWFLQKTLSKRGLVEHREYSLQPRKACLKHLEFLKIRFVIFSRKLVQQY